jgi:hypothetical protein
MDSIERTLRHELGHAVCGVQLGATAKITDEGATMRCDLDWGRKSPSEFEVICTWAAGWIADPSSMSQEDLIMRSVIPGDLRTKAEAYALEHVVPLLDRIEPRVMASMLRDLVEKGEVEITEDW